MIPRTETLQWRELVDDFAKGIFSDEKNIPDYVGKKCSWQNKQWSILRKPNGDYLFQKLTPPRVRGIRYLYAQDTASLLTKLVNQQLKRYREHQDYL